MNYADILARLSGIPTSTAMAARTANQQLILSTCPNPRVARKIAQVLVAERLAACVNIVPVAESVYRWKGKIESAREWLLIIKSRRADYPKIERRLRALHPYELPEIIAVPIARGLPAYLAWLNNPDKT